MTKIILDEYQKKANDIWNVYQMKYLYKLNDS